MYSIWGFRSIKGELIFIGVLLVILAVTLLCEYRQKWILKKYEAEKKCQEQEQIEL